MKSEAIKSLVAKCKNAAVEYKRVGGMSCGKISCGGAV